MKAEEFNRNHYQTPIDIVRAVEIKLGMSFTVDIAADPMNKKANRFVTQEHDAFSFNWRLEFGEKAVIWMNPPYKDKTHPILDWTSKAIIESRSGLFVVGCLPADPSTVWFRKNVMNIAPLVLVPTSRINFNRPDGTPTDRNDRPSILPVWCPFSTGTTTFVELEV